MNSISGVHVGYTCVEPAPISLHIQIIDRTFKVLLSGTPGYLSDLLLKPATIGHARSQSTNAPDRLVVPWYSAERSAGTSYSDAALKMWNSLPANIRNLNSLDTFKKHLKTHYIKSHFYGL